MFPIVKSACTAAIVAAGWNLFVEDLYAGQLVGSDNKEKNRGINVID
jgi:hypothetical protein